MILRDYQEDALTALQDYWNEGGDNPLVVMATGTGKSLTEATLALRLITDYDGLRIVSVTHVQELIEQNYLEFANIAPFAPAGMYSAGLNARDLHSQVLFAGIASIYRRVAQLGWVDLLIVDEAHLIPRNADTMYGTFISALLAINPDMRVVGFTATPYRTDSGRLDDGEERLFDKVVYEYDIADGIRDGYLSRLVSKGTATSFNLDGVARRGGDYVPGALQAACDKDHITQAAVAEIVAAGQNRRSWLTFCAGVEHAHHVRDAIAAHGISCATITGDTPKNERRQLLDDFKTGKLRCLTNNSVLTTGFNAPGVDLIAGLRPTLSTGLYVQIAGRGTRPVYGNGFDLSTLEGRMQAIASGPKQNCLYLDFARNVIRHGPVDDVQPRKPGKGSGEPPVKECEVCHTLVPISCRECPECGAPFAMKDEAKHEATATVEPILKLDAKVPRQFAVTSRHFSLHHNAAGNESVRVQFAAGGLAYQMWLSIAKAPGRANKFWRDHGGDAPCPATVDEWLARQGELRPTQHFTARKSGKYWEILFVKSQPEGCFGTDLPAHLQDQEVF